MDPITKNYLEFSYKDPISDIVYTSTAYVDFPERFAYIEVELMNPSTHEVITDEELTSLGYIDKKVSEFIEVKIEDTEYSQPDDVHGYWPIDDENEFHMTSYNLTVIVKPIYDYTGKEPRLKYEGTEFKKIILRNYYSINDMDFNDNARQGLIANPGRTYSATFVAPSAGTYYFQIDTKEAEFKNYNYLKANFEDTEEGRLLYVTLEEGELYEFSIYNGTSKILGVNISHGVYEK